MGKLILFLTPDEIMDNFYHSESDYSFHNFTMYLKKYVPHMYKHRYRLWKDTNQGA